MMDQSGMVVKPAPKKVDLHQKRETYPENDMDLHREAMKSSPK